MSEFPSYRPIQQFVLDELNLKKSCLYFTIKFLDKSNF